ncbi:MAG TPA: response regulator [bacterium]|nr:response regulator [bacterium]HQL62863.1 response regulator [bacterium]
MKIILVDDDSDMLFLTSMALERIGGHEVVGFHSANDALEYARANPPDAILTDYLMEDMDGPEFLSRILAQEETARIPVVFLTAKTDANTAERLRTLGAKGMIRKPFDLMKIAEEFERILAG